MKLSLLLIQLFSRVSIKIFGFSSFKKKSLDSKSVGLRLTAALKELGPTFIKLGQFLGTRPDIIGKDLAKELQSLQDDLPPFEMEVAKKSIIDEIGEEKFKQIQDLSKPIAAASIAQVHFAKIEDKKYAIKILRPEIEKKFNEELAQVYSDLYGLKIIGYRFFTVYGEWGRPDMFYLKYLMYNFKDDFLSGLNKSKGLVDGIQIRLV